jgi:hypothetical protein
MAINWQDVITTVAATGVGGTALLGSAAWLIKALISDRLTRDAEAFKIQVKADADIEIERMRAFLARASRVHESTVDTLAKLYRHFYEAQGYFQRMASSARFEGEVSQDEYHRLLAKAIESARNELSKGRLLIPPELAQQCDGFFNILFAGRTDLAFAQHPVIADGLQHAKFWDSAQKNAYEEVPKLLQQIERAARSVIHGE